jgi:hypothetical protein
LADLEFSYHTKPYDHQREECEKHGTEPGRALFWEMGTGKTKPVIDQAVAMYEAGEISGLAVIAPKGVHRNWVTDELPAHMPPEMLEKAALFDWPSNYTAKYQERRMAKLMQWDRGMPVLAMSYPGIMTRKGGRFFRRFLDKYRCMYGLDESQLVGKPNAARTKRVVASSRYAPYTRVMSGTPITNSPFDGFSQIKCLDESAWDSIGCKNFAAFKQFFGIWMVRELGRTGKSFPELVAYRNQHILKEMVSKWGSRLLKEDVLDLPPKLYTKRRFQLDPEAVRVYKEVRDDYIAFLDDGGTVTAPLAITRLIRLQQIASGYVPEDKDHEDLRPLGTTGNPRVQLLLDTLQEHRGRSTIVWAKYRHDFKIIAAALRKAKITFVEYHGATPDPKRDEAKKRFQAKDVEVFLANPSAAGLGLTLTAATVVIFYNTTYKYDHRVQAEDRAHRIGQEHPVLYVDLLGMLSPTQMYTVDEGIVQALRKKERLASVVLGDEFREWI